MRKINGFSRKMISKWWVLHIYVRFPESTFDIIWFNLGEWWFGGEYVSPFSSRNLFDNMCILSVSGYLNLASAHLCKIQRPQNDLITTKTSPQMLRIGEIMGDHGKNSKLCSSLKYIILCPGKKNDVYWCVAFTCIHTQATDFGVLKLIFQLFKPLSLKWLSWMVFIHVSGV